MTATHTSKGATRAISRRVWRHTQCITLMRKVSAKNRTAADPYFYMGIAAVKAGERPAVIKNHFTRLFKLCPDYPNALAYYYMAIVHYTYKEYPEAVVQLNKYFDIANQQPNPAYDAVYEEASTYLYWSEFLADAQKETGFPAVLIGQKRLPMPPAIITT